MGTAARSLGWLRNAVLGVLVAAICAGLFLPIYTDEVGWRLQERAAFDGLDKLYSEVCGPNTLAVPPFWMMPARYYSALFNSLFADPLYVRLSGVLYALVWVGMVLLVVRRIADRAGDRFALSTLALGLMSLGVMPLVMVLSRPEQPILLAFTGALLIALAAWKQDGVVTPVRTAWWRTVAILLLALVAMSYHVKAVATVPLFLVCLAFAAKGAGTILPRLVAGATLVGAGVWAGHYWVDRFACPGDASVRADYADNTGAALVSVTEQSQLWPLIGKALSQVSLLVYAGLPAPRNNPMAGWLPYGQISADDSFTWFLALSFVWTLLLIAGLYCLLLAARKAWQERRLDSRPVLALALIATALGWSALGFNAIYEATFTIPMMMFAVVLALSTYEGDARFAAAIRAGAAGIGLAAIVSVALVAAIYGPSLVAASQQRGYINGQPYSISPFGFPALRRDILGAARKCGLNDPDGQTKLMIDDMTYFPFMKSSLPQHRGGVFIPVLSRDPMDYLRSIKSDGIIASCHVLPPEVRARAKSQGQFCCVAPL